MSWGNWIGAAASIGSAYLGYRGAQSAGQGATQAAQQSNDLMWRMYQQDQQRQQPFYNTSVAADRQVAALLGLGNTTPTNSQYYDRAEDGTPIMRADMANDPRYRQAWDNLLREHQNQWRTGYWSGSDPNWIQGRLEGTLGRIQPQQQQQGGELDWLRNLPGYQFALDQGQRSVESSAAARGGLNSGSTLKALTRYGQGMADQQYRSHLSDLMQLSGRGQAQATQMGSQGMQYASGMGANLQNAAQQRAQSTYDSNAAIQNGLQNAWYFYNRSQGMRGGP
jgi:hypothetical protein